MQSYQQLMTVFDPSFEEVYRHPAFLQNFFNLLQYSENGSVVHLGKVLRQRDDLLQPGDTLLIACKTYDNLRVFGGQSVIQKAGLGVDHSQDIGGIATLTLDSSLLAKGLIDATDLKQSAVAHKDLNAPRDWVLVGTTLYVAAHDGIAAIDLKTDDIQFVRSELLQSPHSVAKTSDGLLCVSSSGADMILFYDPRTARFTKHFSAWEAGIQTCMGKSLRRINAFEDQELSLYLQTLISKHGFELMRFSREHPFSKKELLIAEQTAHFNSTLTHPDGQTVLTTVFGTSQFDEKTGKRIELEGTGGKVVAFSNEKRIQDVVVGLWCPHKVVLIGQKDEKNYFMVTNTGVGKVYLYEEAQAKPLDWSLVGELDFEDLPETKYSEVSWLQAITPTISADGDRAFLSGFDSNRRGIYVIDLIDRSYQFIHTGEGIAAHLSVYIPT